MSKFANCVRFVVKEDCVDDFIAGFTDSNFQPDGNVSERNVSKWRKGICVVWRL